MRGVGEEKFSISNFSPLIYTSFTGQCGKENKRALHSASAALGSTSRSRPSTTSSCYNLGDEGENDAGTKAGNEGGSKGGNDDGTKAKVAQRVKSFLSLNISFFLI